MDLDTYFGLIDYLDNGNYPPDYNAQQRRHFRKMALFYFTRQQRLYRRNRKEPEKSQRVVTINELEIILYNMHSDPLAGHFGKKKTIERVLSRYYWPTLGKDIVEYIKTCDTCQRIGKPTRQEALHPLQVSTAFDRIGIDVVGPLDITEDGNCYIITATDYLTKWPEARAVPTADANTTAQFIFEEIICRHGAPNTILSDRGRNFIAQTVEELCKRMNIHHQLSSPYHPQTNGLVERFNRTLCETLKKISVNNKSWDKALPAALFAYRTVNHDITQYEPFYLVYGRMARLPIEVEIETIPHTPYTEKEYQNILQRRLGSILGLLLEARVTTYEKIKHFQEKLKKK